MKKIILPLLLIIAVVLALNSYARGPVLPKATAQSVSGLPFAGASSATGAGNPYDGKGELLQTWQGTLSTTALGVVCTGSATTRVSVKALTITCTTAQYVDFYTGSTVNGTKTLAHIYCPALTPQVLTRDLLGTGLTTAFGDSLTILGGNTGACAILYSVQSPTQ